MAASSSAAATVAHADPDPWLPGFAWAVPVAFSGPVSSCRFEQGDVLHLSRAGYGDWSGGVPGPWLQVLDPPRSARAASGAADAGRFAASWGSPVEIELDEGEGAPTRRLTTTQGRLFTTLWRGDLAALEAMTPPEPPMLQGELQRALEAALPTVREALASGGRRGSAKAKRDASALLFVASLDCAADASQAKAETIFSALASRFEVQLHDASPEALGLPEAERAHPALRVRALRIDGADEAGVTEALKAVLYSPGVKSKGSAPGAQPTASTPGAKSKGSDEGEATARKDRFSLARHGLLVPLIEEPVEPEEPAIAGAD